MDPMLLTLGFAAAAVGAVLVANALRAPQVDAEAVLAELDTEPTVLDEFATRLKDPIVTRLLRPLAGAIGEKIAVLVPRRRADQLRHRLLVAGASAKVGPEEFVVMQGVGLGAGVLLGLLVAQTSGYHGFGLIRMVVVPSPSCPRKFQPQAHTVPSDFNARVCCRPAAIAVTLPIVPAWVPGL